MGVPVPMAREPRASRARRLALSLSLATKYATSLPLAPSLPIIIAHLKYASG